MCCKARIAKCAACRAGTSVEKYCKKYPFTIGCKGPNICATVKCTIPKCKRGERYIKPNPRTGNCCGKCIKGSPDCEKSVRVCPIGYKRELKYKFGMVYRKRGKTSTGRKLLSKSGGCHGRSLLSRIGCRRRRPMCPPVYHCVPEDHYRVHGGKLYCKADDDAHLIVTKRI